ncbi:MAG: GntR family transcriptional regulator [Rhodobacter sp.]|nr:GntR family transcriptional regulator [Rhodobacter sp.]
MADTLPTSRVGTPDIYQDLRQRLTMGGFAPGQKLLPGPLKDEYGCSANTIREVLLRLSAAGLAQYEDQRGFRAQAASAQRKSDLTKFRILLEQEGATASIRRGGIEWEAQLTAAHHKLSHIEAEIDRRGMEPPVVRLWCTAEWEFHDALGAACGSPFLRQTFRAIFDQFRQQHVTEAGKYGFATGNVAEHRRIVDAALDRDEAACRAQIHAHLERNLLPDS